MMVALVSMSFVSCSDDDDDNGSSNSSIVGTWIYEEGYYYNLVTFYEDGTGVWIEEDEEEYDSYEEEEFSYIYSPSSNKLTMYFKGEKETSTVYVNGDTMIMDGDIYQRVK